MVQILAISGTNLSLLGLQAELGETPRHGSALFVQLRIWNRRWGVIPSKILKMYFSMGTPICCFDATIVADKLISKNIDLAKSMFFEISLCL